MVFNVTLNGYDYYRTVDPHVTRHDEMVTRVTNLEIEPRTSVLVTRRSSRQSYTGYPRWVNKTIFFIDLRPVSGFLFIFFSFCKKCNYYCVFSIVSNDVERWLLVSCHAESVVSPTARSLSRRKTLSFFIVFTIIYFPMILFKPFCKFTF